MAPSHGFWQAALFSCHSDLFRGLLESPHKVVACFPQGSQSKREQGSSCSIFYSLASEVPLSFLQCPVGYTGQFCSAWRGVSKAMKGKTVGGHPTDWLQQHLIYLGEGFNSHLLHPLGSISRAAPAWRGNKGLPLTKVMGPKM